MRRKILPGRARVQIYTVSPEEIDRSHDRASLRLAQREL